MHLIYLGSATFLSFLRLTGSPFSVAAVTANSDVYLNHLESFLKYSGSVFPLDLQTLQPKRGHWHWSWEYPQIMRTVSLAWHRLFNTRVIPGQLWLSRVRLCDPMDCSPPGFSCPWYSPGKNTGVPGSWWEAGHASRVGFSLPWHLLPLSSSHSFH